MYCRILYVLCVGIVFTQWVESREYNYQPPLVEDNLDIDYWQTTLFKKECSININGDLVDAQPLLLVPNSKDFYNPDKSGIIHIPSNKEIEFHCNKGFNAPFTNLQVIKPKCVSGDDFIVNGRTYKFKEFVCSKTNLYEALPTTRKCFNNAMIIEVGFKITNNRFVKLMEICHHETSGATYYVQHSLSPFNIKYQQKVIRPYFQQGQFYKKLNINKLYTQTKQMATVGQIVGGIEKKYFDIDKYVYLARGHLASKTDYAYGIQQLATFFYVNVAPQWQTFNAGNWLAVEDSVRKYISNKNINAELYTGTWGVSSLKDRNGKFQELYLHLDSNNKHRVPVPKLYYKVVIDRKTRNGIVLLGVNNPHLTLDEIQRDYIICNDIGNQINWINWQKEDIMKGYSYACSVPDFIKTVNHLPNLNVKGILN